jgi:hypothetical protein
LEEVQMKQLKRRSLFVALTGIALAGAFYAGIAYAADPKLDDADAACEKAIALLKAAENPGVKNPFGGHREKAVLDLEKARKEIAAAKKWADNPKHQPPAAK